MQVDRLLSYQLPCYSIIHETVKLMRALYLHFCSFTQSQANLKAAVPPETRSVEPSLQFFGDGFLKYAPLIKQNTFREISFSFKTSQKNGLLLYGPDSYDGLFTSFEVVNGELVYQYNNGYASKDAVFTHKSGVMVDDGKVHSVVKSTTDLKIDGKVVAKFDAESQELSAIMLYIGGVPFGQKLQSR